LATHRQEGNVTAGGRRDAAVALAPNSE